MFEYPNKERGSYYQQNYIVLLENYYRYNLTSMRDQEAYTKARTSYWDSLAKQPRPRRWLARYYHDLLIHQFQLVVSPNSRILELGCGEGEMLNALNPSVGVGIDFSGEMIRKARGNFTHLNFLLGDAHSLPDLPDNVKFDYVILSDLINDVWDVQAVLQEVKNVSHPRTRILINIYSKLWQIPLGIAHRLIRGTPSLEQNWLTLQDLENILTLSGLESIKHDVAILLPINIPIVSWLTNRILVKIWPFSKFALTNFIVSRLVPEPQLNPRLSDVSVIVPARNESGNISAILERIPKLGNKTEIIFVEGHSRDNMYEEIQIQIQRHNRKASLLKQESIGKAQAVWQGFSAAEGDILMILDADLSVLPEDLSRFYDALVTGKADFVNGVRLVYPMEKGAMRPLNLLGNKFFSLAFSWLLGQSVKDTLCGTKVLWRHDYEALRINWLHFGKSDPFGDFDLLFGATKLGLKIRDLPVRYRERTYGATNIDRWRHGWLLLRMVFNAARWIKFA